MSRVSDPAALPVELAIGRFRACKTKTGTARGARRRNIE